MNHDAVQLPIRKVEAINARSNPLNVETVASLHHLPLYLECHSEVILLFHAQLPFVFPN